MTAGGAQRPTPAPKVESAPVEEPKPKHVWGSREKDTADRAEYRRELIVELRPVFLEAISSLEQTSGLTMQQPEREALLTKFLESKLPVSVRNIRRVALTLFGEECGPTPEERAEYCMTRDAHNLTQEQFKEKWQPHVNKTWGGAADTRRPINNGGAQ